MGEQAKNSVQAVIRTFAIVEAIKRRGEATVTELADDLDLPASTVHNHIRTLCQIDYVVEADKRYRLAARFAHVGDHVKWQRPVFEVSQSALEHLADTTGEIANLLVEENGRGIYLGTEYGQHGLRNFANVRRRDHLHSTASGKAILAHLPESRVDAVVDEWGLPAKTENTITDREELFDDLATVRERGFALNDMENTDGLRAVGAPIELPDGSYAALSVSGPVTRVRDDRFREALPERVVEATKAVEADIVP